MSRRFVNISDPEFDLTPVKVMVVKRGKVHGFIGRWTIACTGCSCDCGDGYPCGHGASGCSECGYTGKRRDAMWLPLPIRIQRTLMAERRKR